tara:strand:- start:2018 stop:2152 length:135 start_codon:yes stop_codon:yes gene_type:complete
MQEFEIECEECDTNSIVLTRGHVEFCPCCGRRVEAEITDSNIED